MNENNISVKLKRIEENISNLKSLLGVKEDGQIEDMEKILNPETGLAITKRDENGNAIEAELRPGYTFEKLGITGALFENFETLTFTEEISSIPKNLLSGSSKIKKLIIKNPNFKNDHISIVNNSVVTGSVLGQATGLEEIEGNINDIWRNTFSGSASTLRKITLGPKVTSLYGEAFQNCKALEMDTFPSQVREIGGYFASGGGAGTFDGCESISFSEIPENVVLKSQGTKYTHYTQNMFRNCKNLTLSKIPASWWMLGDSFFANCGKITISDLSNVTVLGSYAFQNCTGITNIILGPVTKWGGYGNAFQNCSNLKAVWVDNGLTSFSSSTFNGCTSLLKIYIDKPRSTVEAMSYYSSKWSATNATIICNDDADFLTKEEFKAIDWANYTE